jgi:glycosyltransferase involved in cell wall biosynthesis
MSKIKVLWFCNTPANGGDVVYRGGAGSGSWLRTLDIAIQSKVELHVAFYHAENVEFSVGETRYYGMRRYKSFLDSITSRFMERFFNAVRDDSNKISYLDIVCRVNPDLIHIHGTENSFGCLVDSTSTPVVISIQGVLSVWDKIYSRGLGERLMFVRNFDFKSIKNIFFPTNFYNAKVKFKRMAFVERKNLKRANYIIGRTRFDRLVAGFLAPQSRYFHCDEIMRDEFINAAWAPLTYYDNLIRLHTTSDNVYYKGIEMICEAILHLKGAGYSCRWGVAGISEGDLIVKVAKKKFGVLFPAGELIFLGKKTAHDLVKYMNNSDLYVMPSNIENSPNALCEAMLLGMPCIATNVGGTSDFIGDNNGILIQSGDSYSLAAAIVDLYGSPEKALFIGKNARKYALERHDCKRVVGELVEIYKSILSANLSIIENSTIKRF